MALGKLLGKQSKTAEARAVYEKGCQATQGENPYIWQVLFVFANFAMFVPSFHMLALEFSCTTKF